VKVVQNNFLVIGYLSSMCAVKETTASWWLLPVVVTFALAGTLARAVRKK